MVGEKYSKTSEPITVAAIAGIIMNKIVGVIIKNRCLDAFAFAVELDAFTVEFELGWSSLFRG